MSAKRDSQVILSFIKELQKYDNPKVIVNDMLKGYYHMIQDGPSNHTHAAEVYNFGEGLKKHLGKVKKINPLIVFFLRNKEE